MREALRIRRGVQNTATNVQRHCEYEQFIQGLMDENKQATTLREFLK
jgi:hypothetical protein